VQENASNLDAEKQFRIRMSLIGRLPQHGDHNLNVKKLANDINEVRVWVWNKVSEPFYVLAR